MCVCVGGVGAQAVKRAQKMAHLALLRRSVLAEQQDGADARYLADTNGRVRDDCSRLTFV